MDPNIFRKFSENLKKILLLSEKIAKDSGRSIDSEDMLLALVLTKGTLASDILTSFEVVPERVSIVAKLVGSGEKKKSVAGLSDGARKVIQNAVQIAAGHNHALIDAEHLLLALLSDSKLNSYSIIERIGVDPQKISDQLTTIFNEISKASSGFAADQGFGQPNFEVPMDDFPNDFGGEGIRTATKEQEKSFLEQYTTNLTAMAKDGKLDPLVGREPEIERVTQILSRRTKNNPLLIGDAGVGKTAIVEGLAQKINQGSVPQNLIGRTILSLDIGALLAGTMYRGQFESRMKKLLSEIQADGKIILFIDEIHTTIGTGSAEGSLDTANMLKPILSRGQLQVIGATTFDEYKKHIEKDPAYERRFQVVQVLEPNVLNTIKILKGLRSRYEKHHGIKFTQNALYSAAELAYRYISDRQMPDKAIDLLDEAAAATNIVSSDSVKLAKLESQLSEIQSQKEEAVNNENYEAATSLREREIKVTDKIKAIEGSIKQNRQKVIDSADIERVVAKWTGINVENLTSDERAKYLKLEDKLRNEVIGQDEAISSIARSIRRSRAGVSDPNRPIGSYLFLGPTGVGKTHLSKTLAKMLFGTEENLIKIDMSEFMEKHNVSRLVGAPAGYVGYDDGGKLTEAVRKKPFSIILFDEIEKAHPEVFNILLQILEDGHLTDAKGRSVNFRNTIIILTSNLGTSDLKRAQEIGFQSKNGSDSKYENLKKMVMETITKELRPELLNRLDSIVVFKPLGEKDIITIVDLGLKDLSKRLKKQGIKFSTTKEVKKFIFEQGYCEEYGARPVRRVISEKLEDPISENIIAGKFETGDKITAHLLSGSIVLKK